MVKKVPVTVDLIKAIVQHYGQEHADLKDLRLVVMCVLAFAGLFCAQEDHFVVHVPQSKTDVYRKGQDVFIYKSSKETCPGILLDRYLQKASVVLCDSTDFLFRNVIYLKSESCYTLGKKEVSYGRFREMLKHVLKNWAMTISCMDCIVFVRVEQRQSLRIYNLTARKGC